MQHRVSLYVTLDRIDLFRNVSIEIKFDFYFGATQTTRNNPHSWRKQLRLPLIIAYRACFIGQSFNFGSVATCSISKRGLISFFTNLDTKKILDREFLRSTIRVLLFWAYLDWLLRYVTTFSFSISENLRMNSWPDDLVLYILPWRRVLSLSMNRVCLEFRIVSRKDSSD